MPERKVMTLHLPDKEMEALEEMCRRKELTKTALIRQALRLLEMGQGRLDAGDRVVFEGEDRGRYEMLIF
jgi:hypothetical protein